MGDTRSAAIFLAIVMAIVLYFYMFYQDKESSEGTDKSVKGKQNNKNVKTKETPKIIIHEKKFKDLCGDESRKIIDFNQYVSRETETIEK